MAAKNIPYGVTDFRLIRANNYYYVDKTSYIALVENAARFFFLYALVVSVNLYL